MRSTAVLPASFTHHRHVSYAVCILLNNSSLSSQQGYPVYISFTGDSKGEQSDYVIPVECDTSAPQHGAAAGYRRSVSTMLLGCWFLNEDNHRQPLWSTVINRIVSAYNLFHVYTVPRIGPRDPVAQALFLSLLFLQLFPVSMNFVMLPFFAQNCFRIGELAFNDLPRRRFESSFVEQRASQSRGKRASCLFKGACLTSRTFLLDWSNLLRPSIFRSRRYYRYWRLPRAQLLEARLS